MDGWFWAICACGDGGLRPDLCRRAGPIQLPVYDQGEVSCGDLRVVLPRDGAGGRRPFGRADGVVQCGSGVWLSAAGDAPRVSDGIVGAVVRAAELVLPCEAASRGEEVYGVHAEAG